MINGLALLPVGDVKEGMEYLMDNPVPLSEQLLDYFDTTYVSGAYKAITRTKSIAQFLNAVGHTIQY